MVVCIFVGNHDFHGIGIRIAFCLQWFSSIAAPLFSPSETQGLRFSLDAFAAATFLALFIVTVSTEVADLQVVEVYIVFLLIFRADLSLVPLYL
jgi:hypothetical protein